MKSLVTYLQKHLSGEVISTPSALQAFSRDASPFSKPAQAIVFARDEKDIRKTLLFLSQLAMKGRQLSVTMRGGGSDLSGAANGGDLIIVTPTYLNQVLRADSRQRTYLVQAGLSVAQSQTLLADHANFLPAINNLPATATIGGALANDSYSSYSLKYGRISQSVSGLKVILANGEVIVINHLTQRQLMDKTTQDTFEGDIYRELSQLFFNQESPYYYKTCPLFAKQEDGSPTIIGGYNVADICQENGDINLIPLFAGSQGSLGVISEIQFQAQPYNPQPVGMIVSGNDIDVCLQFSQRIQPLEPAAVTYFSGSCFAALKQQSPFLLRDFQNLDQTDVNLLIEFDDINLGQVSKKLKQASALAETLELGYEVLSDPATYQNTDQIRSAFSALMAGQPQNNAVFYPLSGACLAPENWSQCLQDLEKLCKKQNLPCLTYGEIALGQLNIVSQLDPASPLGWQRWRRFMNEYFKVIEKYAGQIHISRQEGILRGTFLKQSLDEASLNLLQTIKRLFDPCDILNPHIKLGAQENTLNKYIQYSPPTHYNYAGLQRLL